MKMSLLVPKVIVADVSLFLIIFEEGLISITPVSKPNVLVLLGTRSVKLVFKLFIVLLKKLF
ncbi:hypothetical protein FLACHUCJ7_00279 [Flavobacterium chungangense]|uniref:Uncharacterized protein n=1 Tax=Flavobacterium chungangense TaxID=554283 RepID=A0A6V6YNJ7_9FLAO|nr:hypothetical protein FLACHUCJ7_00279 [Flavobacterium chungangense]